MNIWFRIIISTTLAYFSYSFLRCSCIQLPNEAECLAGGCFWRNRICLSIECENRVTETECESYSLTSDWDSNCKWYDGKCYDVDDQCNSASCSDTHFCIYEDEKCLVAGVYRKIKCADIGSLVDCKDRKVEQDTYCQFNDTSQTCSEINADTSCEQITSKIPCEGLYCQWSAQENSCRSKLCTAFRSNYTCIWAVNATRQFTLCQWNSTRDYCQDAVDQNTQQLVNTSACSLDTDFAYYFDGNKCNICGSMSSKSIILSLMIILCITII